VQEQQVMIEQLQQQNEHLATEIEALKAIEKK